MSTKSFILGVSLILALACTSCIVIEIKAPTRYSGFDQLTSPEKNRVMFITDTVPYSYGADSVVFAITATQLKTYMNQFDSCLIYFWKPDCAAPNCKSPVAVQEYCQRNNIQFVLIGENYIAAKSMLVMSSILEYPKFVINTFHYDADLQRVYKRKFKQELFGDSEYDKNPYAIYWIYRNAIFRKFFFEN
ncbi:MAG: hypothetical protein LBK03_00165 [Bacteroidales bacterium]|jgi:hypothetical protein|nr:hypothetical protein [Bacteroidales bacterium]